jgi:hypothetical protein
LAEPTHLRGLRGWVDISGDYANLGIDRQTELSPAGRWR